MRDVKQYYDKIPYFSDAFRDFSPVRLAAVMEFLKLKDFDLENARVLEIGCSYGGNIFSFALAFKHAHVVGIDISGAQIAKANELKEQFNLTNIEFYERDIASLSEADMKSLGEFDFIIAHGVFSWVSESIRKAMLEKISTLLSPHGVAQVSFNVLPGWSSLSIIREFMLFASGDSVGDDAIKKCDKELSFLLDYFKFSLQSLSGSDKKIASQTQQLLASQAEFTRKLIKSGKDFYISHEFLEPSNDPIYFSHFSKLLREAGLCYLLDASLVDAFITNVGIPRFDSHIRANYKSKESREQLNDFMYNRSFRKAIIVRPQMLGGASAGTPEWDISVKSDSLLSLHFAVKFDKKDDGYYSCGLRQNEAYAWLYEMFNEAYPASLSFNQILSKFKADISQDEIKSIYLALLDVVANAQPNMSVYPLKNIKYEAKKTRLKPRFKGYLEYFSKTQNPVIAMANELNERISLGQLESSVALLFNGETIEQIAKNAKTIAAKMGQEIDAYELVLNLSQKLEAAYYFEEIKEGESATA
ncbi:class I SAM-dependent methyltransferase [Campylobacter sp. 19-13652]|uniref:class I SAM-dependent methyltransferase n=1 Tax=Campylobacter sp. 19-13652 TaxID=2840180 RepID=UPI001C7903E7|nr:class I SAM-dependent methyltransferase [Campylobacter sp. 19-13652]BCX78626.1 methyltransferase [Campylobacter sp. 19-13652]